MKSATSKARLRLAKLQALAEQGIDGEKEVARRKLARLKAAFDFTQRDPTETPDLFADFKFRPSENARHIARFEAGEINISNAVKWAIEKAAGIECKYEGLNLKAHATAATANKLAAIARHISLSFRELLSKFAMVDGVRFQDRTAFAMGLYDGMMNERRGHGDRLPGGFMPVKRRKQKVKAMAVGTAPRLTVHPYSLGVDLGKQVRFSAPLAGVAAELDERLTKALTA